MKRITWTLVAAGCLAAFIVGGVVLPHSQPAASDHTGRRFPPESQAAVQQLQTLSDGFAAVAAAVVPSVVTITSEKTIQPAENPFSQFNDPFFQRFFGRMPSPQAYKQRGLGSGVIVDSNGTILTNNHVVRGADELTVILSDGKKYDAKVLGADPRTDLAVLKVDAKDLPAMPFADSDKVRVGEWVMAVGSPFSENLEATVTTGIVSGKGRSGMQLSDYEDFIQTDAAINPGNSGGALVDMDGELIGINSAIASRAGGYDGIGFAIPSNLAMDVMTDLIKTGKVTRGWLGVGIQNLTPDLADAMGIGQDHGAVITSVQKDGPSEKAGLKSGDVIATYDGKPVKDSQELRLAVAQDKPGTEATLGILRDGRQEDYRVVLGEYPENGEKGSTSPAETTHEELGLTVAPVTPDLAQQFDLGDATGLVITAVESGSPADDAGLQPGDLVRKVNGDKVDSTRAYESAVEGTRKDKPVLLQIERQGNTFFVALRAEKEK
jgi:serine protease Do